jgi:hypothetical protein
MIESTLFRYGIQCGSSLVLMTIALLRVLPMVDPLFDYLGGLSRWTYYGLALVCFASAAWPYSKAVILWSAIGRELTCLEEKVGQQDEAKS